MTKRVYSVYLSSASVIDPLLQHTQTYMREGLILQLQEMSPTPIFVSVQTYEKSLVVN